MIQQENNHKPLSYMLLTAGIILPPALLFSISADLPHIFLFTLLGMAFSLLLRRPVPYSDRSVIYSLVVSIVAASLFDLVFPMRDNRLGYISIFFYPNILVPFLLYCAVCVTMFRPHPRGLGIIIACALVCMVFGGDVFNNNVPGERLPFCTPLVRQIYRFFGMITVLEMVMMLAAMFYCVKGTNRVEVRKLQTRRLLLKAAILLLVPILGGGGMYYYLRHENTFRHIENYLLRIGVKKFMRQPGRIEFGKQVDLNVTISPEIQQNQSLILLRVKSKTSPGYLRGKAYVNYAKGFWTVPEGGGPTFKEEKHTGMIAYTTFLVPPESKSGVKQYDVFPAGGFSTQFLLLSGGARRIDIIADKLECSRDGNIEVKEWMKDGGYSYFTEKAEQETAWPLPESPERPEYLQVPPELVPALDSFMAEAMKAYTGKPLTDSLLIAYLIRYFNNHLKYSLQGSDPKGGDPAMHFLLNSRQGHCELFATSMVLLLRRQGIPARYVTGFICEEQHPSGSYFVSRLGNAHAWLEAWPRDRKRWEVVEPTPASGVPNFHHRWGVAEHWGDRFSLMFRETLALLRRGVVAKAIITVAGAIYDLLYDFVAHPVRGPLLLFAFIAGGWWLRRRWRRHKFVREMTLSDRLAALQRVFDRIEKTLSRIYGENREAGETVDEWLTRLEKKQPVPEEIMTAVSRYRELRFSGNEPTVGDLDEFRNGVMITLRRLRCIHINKSRE